MSFEIDSIVRIIKQPDHVPADVEGRVGYVSELREGEAYVHTLSLEPKKLGGAGWIPFDHLVLELGEEWARARERVDGEMSKLMDKCKQNKIEWDALIRMVAKNHRVPTGTVRAIYEELDVWQKHKR